MNPKTVIVAIVIVVFVFAGSYLFYGMYLQSNNLQPPVDNSASAQQISYDYCFIQEVHPDFVQNATMIHLTPYDLKDFPKYENAMKDVNNFSKDWINGQRTGGDFIDYQRQFSDFQNLSCRNMSYTECMSRDLPVMFEYEGRYHEVICWPDFGSSASHPFR